jgi:hypothetical protein
MTIQRTVYASPVEALAALIRAFLADEQRYQLSSAEFYARYQNGEMGDRDGGSGGQSLAGCVGMSWEAADNCKASSVRRRRTAPIRTKRRMACRS